jgi:HlyD family secretion protein
MKLQQLDKLKIDPGSKRRRRNLVTYIFVFVAILVVAAAAIGWPRKGEIRTLGKVAAETAKGEPKGVAAPAASAATAAAPAPPAAGKLGGGASASILTMSGYIINRERIELSPRFVTVVKWIGVKKGDAVKKGDVVVLLDDSEQKARLAEADGALARAEAALTNARARFDRAQSVRKAGVQSQQEYEDAEADMRTSEAVVRQAKGAREVAANFLGWTVIRSPIDGVILEKLAEENELVTPQSFGGERSPSTALVALADPKDLQVELDVSETDLSKIHLDQRCRVSPEAYPDKQYDGYVAEISPEASRQKGTLQIKVQIVAPDEYLIPQLSAKVEFLDGGTPDGRAG